VTNVAYNSTVVPCALQGIGLYEGELTIPSRMECKLLNTVHPVAALALCERFTVKPVDLVPSGIDWASSVIGLDDLPDDPLDLELTTQPPHRERPDSPVREQSAPRDSVGWGEDVVSVDGVDGLGCLGARPESSGHPAHRGGLVCSPSHPNGGPSLRRSNRLRHGRSSGLLGA
jgi:hypothetical protein